MQTGEKESCAVLKLEVSVNSWLLMCLQTNRYRWRGTRTWKQWQLCGNGHSIPSDHTLFTEHHSPLKGTGLRGEMAGLGAGAGKAQDKLRTPCDARECASTYRMTGHRRRVQASISTNRTGDMLRRTWHHLCGIPTESRNPIRTHIEGHSSKRLAWPAPICQCHKASQMQEG